MRRKFVYEYEDTSPDGIRFEYADERDEHLDAWVASDGALNIEMNASGALVLSRLLVQFAQCEFSKHFHIHLYKNFDADQPAVLTLVKIQDATQSIGEESKE